MLSISYGRPALIDRLLAAGADVNASKQVADCAANALMVHSCVLHSILDVHVHIHCCTNMYISAFTCPLSVPRQDGETALMLVIHDCNRPGLIERLIAAGANVNAAKKVSSYADRPHQSTAHNCAFMQHRMDGPL